MRKLHVFLKNLLPIVFLYYLGCITFLTHVHIEDGVIYVHSHLVNPFSKDKDSNQYHHHHTYNVLQVLNGVSSFTSEEADFCFFSKIAPFLLLLFAFVFPQLSIIAYNPRNHCSLRAPPAI